MQNSGQYGVSDSPQYVVGRQAASPHIFSISHDNMSIATPAAHALHAQQHHLPHHLHAHNHHYGPHPGHQPHPSLQQIHQTQQLQSHAPHSQHPQFPLPQHPSQQAQQQQQQQQQQQSAQAPAPHQDVQQHQHQQQQQAQQPVQQAREQQQQAREQQQREQEHQMAQQQTAAQQAMVQQLGLGGPNSPEVPSPGVGHPSPNKYNSQQLVVSAAAAAAAAQEDDGLEEEGRSTGGNRWPRQETLTLIKIRSEMDANFRDSGLKGPLWEEVSRKLAEQGYSRTAKKCKEKFENVHKYYKKTKDGKAGRQDGKSYRFFSQLEALYSGQEAALQLGSRLAASAAASLLTDTAAAASLLTGSAVPGKADDYNRLQAAQRQSEVSTGVTLSESMSDDDYDEPESGTGGENHEKSSKKRKRMEGSGKVGASKADFFSALMKNLVEKQESMQQKFLEFMERREQERQERDEAWRRQEMARVGREHELRVQEQALAATRDVALVAFLQKVTGQTLALPQIPTPCPMVVTPAVDSVVTPGPQKPRNLTLATPTPISQQLVTVASADIDPDRDSPIDPNSKRWPKPEVLTLIKLRSDLEPRFQEPGPKAPLWEEISQGMACLGYNRNQKRCKEKWENINKYFRKTKESNKKRPENAKTCPYFHQLELLYHKGVLGTPHHKQVVKVAASSEEKGDHKAVPLAQRIEAAAGTSGAGANSEMVLKMLPVAAEAVQNAAQNTAANSGNGSSGANAGHLFSSPENGSSADRGGPKAHASEAST